MVEKPKFQLIQGEWVSSPEWLELPQSIRMRSPYDRSKFGRARVNHQDVLKAAEARRRQPAYEFWSILAGRFPPVPGADGDDSDLTTLLNAHACFMGIKRPIGSDDAGGRTVAFILKPKSFCVFAPRPPLAFTEKREVPTDLVFVAYVRLDEPDATQPTGVLTHWHFVECDASDPTLPVDFASRYFTRLW